MNQQTAFSPYICLKLLDDRLVRFARSSGEHWDTLCDEKAAEDRVRLTALLEEHAATLKPMDLINAHDHIADSYVEWQTMMARCRAGGKWQKRHLALAFEEAGGKADELKGVLALIPPTEQLALAHQIATLPVVKGAKVGTEENPFLPGTDFDALAALATASNAPTSGSTGDQSSAESGDGIPAST